MIKNYLVREGYSYSPGKDKRHAAGETLQADFGDGPLPHQLEEAPPPPAAPQVATTQPIGEATGTAKK